MWHRLGELMAVLPFREPTETREPAKLPELAFLRPVGGGREWTTSVDALVPVGEG
ncbi:hypothetical protein [Streptomyces boncukensis]|uniref:Uncharacterized protein n=1 Tax=Streptomyces boncukensis TaxID=2711219 RepID=A0A6G4WZI7_9ACTN|nr:hypothetical protein [Streptomyces boncukensis]NGO70538.1 hypothetical protein [Streptomyces boncukensis]